MMSFTPYEVPPQENKGKWFRSHLLGREIELGELYSLGSNDLDLIMAETAEIRSDIDFSFYHFWIILEFNLHCLFRILYF